MEPEFWHRRWEENRIGFHQSEVNRYLRRHMASFAHRLDGAVFVPFCGKSLDVVWLKEQGMDVVGVELSVLAVEAFFDEQGVVAEVTVVGDFRRYATPGITLWVGDYFRLTAALTGPIGAVYDRAALIALPAPMRARYAQHMTTLLRPETPMLLVAPFSSKKPDEGPPFSVSEEEVRGLYGQAFSIELLEGARETAQTHPQLAARGLSWCEDNVYALTRR